MKFRCSKEEIVQALSITSKAISKNPQTPVLSGIYVKAENEHLTFKATNNDIGVICSIEAEIEVPGEIIMPVSYALEVIRKLPGTTVDIEYNQEEKLVVIKSNRSKFSFLSMDAADFPSLEKLQSNVTVQVSDVVLRDLIASTIFACATDESRQVFTGCLLELRDGQMVMAATDTHRLAVKSAALEDFNGNESYIIPSKFLNDLHKILQSDMPRTVTVCCTPTNISFEVDNVYIFSRLIEAKYPDYHRVIPVSFTTNITLKTEEIKPIIDRIALISRTTDYNVVKLEFSNNMVKLSSASPEVGNGEEYASAVIDGEDISIAFNTAYISDAFKIIKSPEFTLSLNGPLLTAGLRTEDEPFFTYVVTPVRS